MTATDGPLAPPAAERHWLDVVRTLAEGFAADAPRIDEASELPVGNLEVLSAGGVDNAVLPVAAGGEGLSFSTFNEIIRLLAAAEPSTATIWLMHIGAAAGLVTLSDPDRSAFYAAELRAGKRFSNALSEPTSGNLFLTPMQVAEPADGGWRLTGAKRFISGSEIADHFLVNAVVDGAPGFFGVAKDDSIGFTPIWDTMGLRGTRSQLVSFTDTLLRKDHRTRPPELTEPNHIAGGLAFISLGVADAALAALSAHAKGRVLPGTGAPVSHLQWVQFEVAEAYVRLKAAALLARQVSWLADHASPDYFAACLEAKLLANQVAADVAQLGVRIGGAAGYLRTSPIQRHFRDAQAGQLMAYSTEVCRDVIGKAVLEVE